MGLAMLISIIAGFCVLNTKASETNKTFNQYKSDYYINYSAYDYYMSSAFTLPYRTMVEQNRSSIVYQGLINAWQIATFDLSNVMDYSKKRVGYYEAFLFDILYKGYEPTSATGTMDKAVKATESSMLKKICKIFFQHFQFKNVKEFYA